MSKGTISVIFLGILKINYVYLDQQDPKFVEVVAKKLKALKENKKFTPAQVVTTLCILYAL